MSSSIPCVLHLDPLSESLSHRWYLERLGARSAFAWWLERVGAMAGVGPLYVVCHGAVERAALVEAAGGAPIRLIDSRHCGERRSLAELAREASAPLWAVLPVGFALAPRGLLEQVHSHHVTAGNTFTAVQGLPQGTSPALFNQALLLAMDECDLPGLPLSVVAAAGRLLQVARSMGGDSPVPIRSRPFVVAPPQHADGPLWPRTLALDAPGGFEIVRRLLSRLDGPEAVDAGFVLWKEAVTRDKAARLAGYQAALRFTPERDTPSDRKRVLYVSNPSAFSGAEQSLCQMVAHVDPARFGRLAWVALEGRLADKLRESGATVTVRGSDFARATVENVLEAQVVLRRLRPDVVHLNAPDGLPVVCAAQCLGIPVVLHVRNGLMSLYEELVGAADAVIVISEFLRREILAFDIPPDRVHRIYNEVDSQHFRRDEGDRERTRRELGIPADAKVALLIARIAPNKRHDLFLEAAARLRPAVPGLRLVLSGEVFSQGEAELYSVIRERAERLGLAEITTWLRFVPDIRALHAMADVLVLCSDREGLGRCVVEAMAMELPVVVTDSGGSHELVGNGERGYLARGGDAADLADKVRQALLGDSQERVARARRYVETELDARVSARRVMDLYDRLLGAEPLVAAAQARTACARAGMGLLFAPPDLANAAGFEMGGPGRDDTARNLFGSKTGATQLKSSDLSGDPKLGALASNGGPTRTHALLAGSPAIDRAEPDEEFTWDQRIFTRPVDGDRNGSALPDIGAFEKQ